MTIMTGRPGVVEIVSDIAKGDEGTALLVVEMLAYDALCDETDRIRPFLERDGKAFIAKRLQGALEHIAKRYPTASPVEKAELEQLAESLCLMVPVAKDGETPAEQDWWQQEPRDRFGRWTKNTVDALRLFTGRGNEKDNQIATRVNSDMAQIANGTRYDRARALGLGLQSVKNPHAQAAGTIARLVGDIGPEAEKVFGRGLTRLAYRYRGTERRPNPQYNQIIQARLARETKRLNTTDQGLPTATQRELSEQKRLSIISDEGASLLWPEVPKQDLAELSLKAGKMPPSKGIIFDAQGHPISEAVGFNGDHYLPFDLKNLKRLRGGSYVRTRTTGGLTDEDIYTGLLTGARQVTVVSNSGVFTIEFDPSLRGGRRYSDKARQMVERYAKLLSTIHRGDVMAQDISPERRAQIRQDAYTKAKGNEGLARQYERDELDKARFESRFTSVPDSVLQERALARAKVELKRQQDKGEVKGVSERTLAQRQADIFRDLKADQRTTQVRYYQLDGDGYEAAQDALAQEFPYFIRTKTYEPRNEFLRRRRIIQRPDEPLPPSPGRDIGYTQRNALKVTGRGRATAETAPDQAPATGQPRPSLGATQAETPTAAETAVWHDALADPARAAALGRLLDRSLAYRAQITGGMEGPISMDDSDHEALANGGQGYGLWVLRAKGSPTRVAQFLLDPNTDEDHINRAISAIEAVYDSIPEGSRAYSKKDADAAIKMLEQSKMLRHPYAEPSADPTYAAPQAPQPYGDILPLVGNQRALDRYAEEHEELARQARSYAGEDGDEKAKAGIDTELREVRLIDKWERDDNGLVNEDNPPAGIKTTAADANIFIRDRENSPLHERLERKQKGWALARAAQVTAAINGTEVQIGPKEEVAHRAPRPSSSRVLLAKRRPTRLSPSARSRPSSPSSLERVLAKRLAEDPQYLDWLKSAPR